MPDNDYRDLRESLSQARACLQDLMIMGETHIDLPASENVSNSCTLGTDAHCHLDGRACGPETLDDIRAELENCTRCPLCKGRSSIVFGQGTPRAELVFVGEAPGGEENQGGEPFTGEAGRLLDRMLFAMGLRRDEVYLCNVQKCQPPGNREPKAEEAAVCAPYLKRQLAAISPRIVVALGRFAARTMLEEETPLERLRGHWHRYEGIDLMPSFHPSHLLRNPASKHEAWEDLKMVMKKLREQGG